MSVPTLSGWIYSTIGYRDFRRRTPKAGGRPSPSPPKNAPLFPRCVIHTWALCRSPKRPKGSKEQKQRQSPLGTRCPRVFRLRKDLHQLSQLPKEGQFTVTVLRRILKDPVSGEPATCFWHWGAGELCLVQHRAMAPCHRLLWNIGKCFHAQAITTDRSHLRHRWSSYAGFRTFLQKTLPCWIWLDLFFPAFQVKKWRQTHGTDGRFPKLLEEVLEARGQATHSMTIWGHRHQTLKRVTWKLPWQVLMYFFHGGLRGPSNPLAALQAVD